MRKVLATAVVAAALFGIGAGTASAGEITGSGKGGPNKELPGVTGSVGRAASECSFSGLEDGIDPPGPSGPGVAPQNWGQIPKEVRDTFGGFNPGIGCNPTRAEG